MNFIDLGVISFLNTFAHKWLMFDQLMVYVSESNSLKGTVYAVLLWWAWFRRREVWKSKREFILSTIIAGGAALFFARVLAMTLPFRLRPIHDPDLLFEIPYGVNAATLEGWSSFPSDHAVMFFAFATGLLYVSRRMGVLALLYAFFIICIPRIYLGLHYTTDVIAGAIIGVGIAYLANVSIIRRLTTRPLLGWLNRHPASFYACFFLLTYQIAVMFGTVRVFAEIALSAVKDMMF